MNFSDWITITSILAAALLAVFKFDELEVIQLKRIWRFATIPLILILLSGISSYYHSNPHPEVLNFFWKRNGLYPGFWPIFWLCLCLASVIIAWNQFINQPPNDELIEKYMDYIKVLEPAKFSAIFRKYEKFFLNQIQRKEWLRYEPIFLMPEWWRIGPNHFKEIFGNHSNRFFEMDMEVLKGLIREQFAIPKSALLKELEYLPPEVVIRDNTPLLNIFLSTAESITGSRNKNILLPTVKECSEKYFHSLDFIEKDKPLMQLKPVDEMALFHHDLMVFYFINFTNWYWVSVIRTQAGVSGFYQYKSWTEYILKQAPVIVESEIDETGIPNHYMLAVNQMLQNIHEWHSMIDRHEITNLGWASEHFIKLKIWTLKMIQGKFSNKVIRNWFIREVKIFLFELIDCHRIYGELFDFAFSEFPINRKDIKEAFEDLTNDEYVTPAERASPDYLWLKKAIVAQYGDIA